MIQEHESRNRVMNPVEPANLDRQKELLRGLRPPTPRLRDVTQPITFINPAPSPYSLDRSLTAMPPLPTRVAGDRGKGGRAWEQGWGALQKNISSIKATGRKSLFGLKPLKTSDLQGRRKTKVNLSPRSEPALLSPGKSKTSMF